MAVKKVVDSYSLILYSPHMSDEIRFDDAAARIAWKIEQDILCRLGLREALESVPPEVRKEILEHWAALIRGDFVDHSDHYQSITRRS
jgi:hypothetical protein